MAVSSLSSEQHLATGPTVARFVAAQIRSLPSLGLDHAIWQVMDPIPNSETPRKVAAVLVPHQFITRFLIRGFKIYSYA